MFLILSLMSKAHPSSRTPWQPQDCLVSPQHLFPLACAQSSLGPLGLSLGWLSQYCPETSKPGFFSWFEECQRPRTQKPLKKKKKEKKKQELVGYVSQRRGLRHSFRWARFLDWAPKLLEISLGSQRKRLPFYLKAKVSLSQEVPLGRMSQEHFYQYYVCVYPRLILLPGFHKLSQDAMGRLYCYLVGSLRK